jgi:uncharacterized repeat protein (TIGR01451 family)
MWLSSLFPRARSKKRGVRSLTRHSPFVARRDVALVVEALENRCVLSCATISGHAYYDANNNGLLDPGETGIANNPIELVNANGVVVGQTTTDANGSYQFSTDSTISTAPKSESFGLPFANNKTNQTQTGALPQFDPSLGTLTSIDLMITGQITSDIRVENEDPAPATITGEISGTLNISGPDFNTQVTTSSSNKTFNAAAWDGLSDFAGTSGTDFGAVTVPGSTTVSLNSSKALADFTGTGTVSISEIARTSSSASGGGNLLAQISSSGSAHLTVVYHYTPDNCLRPGHYTIVQTQLPPGYLHGRESQQGVVLPPSSLPASIPVTLSTSNAPNNDFGDLLPTADLSIVKTANPSPVHTNSALTYTLTVANAGPVTADGVSVVDTLPAGVTFVSASGAGWTVSHAGSTVTASMSSMAVGASSDLTITVKSSATAGSITNTATVTSHTPDNNLSNNQAMVTTLVVPPTFNILSDVFPPPPSTFAPPGSFSFLSKRDFLVITGPNGPDPTLLAQATAVDGVYRTLLNRPADLGSLINDLKFLRSGGSLAQIVQSVWASDEHHAIEVTGFYINFLHRMPDPGSVSAWVAVLRAGVSESNVVHMFLASGEYQAAHASDASFISGLYQDVLGRNVDAGGLAAWEPVLQTSGRDVVITGILQSNELYLSVIDQTYQNILHRQPSASEEQAWLAGLRSGEVTTGTITQSFLASGEFFALAAAASHG